MNETKTLIEEYLAESMVLSYDLMLKSYYMFERMQELYNSSWGWSGESLEDE